MKATIVISGQINGNFTLANKLHNYDEQKRTPFNGFEFIYKTKKEAIADIRAAYNSLVANEPEQRGRIGGISANKARTELYYDASKAIIKK